MHKTGLGEHFGMTSFAGIFFDLDGTLVDTAPDFHAGINRLRNAHGLPAMAYEPIRAVVSEGAKAVVRTGFPDVASDSEAAETLRLAFLADYIEHLADTSVVFAGLEQSLALLEAQHIPWGVVTNKSSTYTRPLMQALGLAKRSAATVSADEVVHSKPHPEPLFKAATMAQVDPSQCVYVGDHARDIEAGRRAGMLTVAVGWGYLPESHSHTTWGADVVCDTTSDFLAWLQTHVVPKKIAE